MPNISQPDLYFDSIDMIDMIFLGVLNAEMYHKWVKNVSLSLALHCLWAGFGSFSLQVIIF